jgi:hypothetical protein
MTYPAASSPFPKLEQPEDVVMRDAPGTTNEDSELGYVSDEDSIEMKLLKKDYQQRSSVSVGVDGEKLNVPSNLPSDRADSIFQIDYTVAFLSPINEPSFILTSIQDHGMRRKITAQKPRCFPASGSAQMEDCCASY